MSEELQTIFASISAILERLKAIETRLEMVEAWQKQQEFMGPFR